MNELASFVLDAFRQVGGIVEPPAYGVYEVLLPDNVARRWAVPAYQRLAFADAPPTQAVHPEEFALIGYAHPLVEMLLEEIRANAASAVVYVRDVRLDRPGLPDLARRAFAFPNARLFEVPGAVEQAAFCHYLRYNFKAALVTDEKRERLVSVVMDAQSGFAVPELAHIEQLTRLTAEAAYEHLPKAPVRWLPDHAVLSLPVLAGLLERATRDALSELETPLTTLQDRAARHLKLDRARLTEYYDEIARGLQQRIERAGATDRLPSLESKLAATQVEREAKLADVEAKHRLRVELELINLQVIGQPKLLLPARIEHRSARVQRTVVWDPVLHRIEPLACDVCGGPATRLMLCSGGHLAHEGCLSSEQCMDCKRVYCQLCVDLVSHCAVCQRPVCRHSLNRCRECQRGTCREHVGLCHAADGKPQQLSIPVAIQPAAQKPPATPVTAEASQPESIPARAPRSKKKPTERRPASQPRRRAIESTPGPANYRIEVFVEPEKPVVTAFVLTKDTQIAARSWIQVDEGIAVECDCEKRHRCLANYTVLKLTDDVKVEALLELEIDELRREYGVAARKVTRFAILSGGWRQVPRVALRGAWHEKA